MLVKYPKVSIRATWSLGWTFKAPTWILGAYDFDIYKEFMQPQLEEKSEGFP